MLTGKQKRYLRSLGATLDPIVFVGKAALTDAITKSALAAIVVHELIKVRVLQNCPEMPSTIIAKLADETGGALVQIIGRNGLIYLRNEEKPRIELP
ncbi:MAG: YhbY family RNA-binding protein [Negativicutes bacterium]|jgi:RNA-binding protein